jgi:hypothetical protein
VVTGADTSAVAEDALPVEACTAQLARILDSEDFEATDRERRFFGYVVEETLAGRGGRIKAYSIAVEVFGRNASFDPQNDPIVRINAGHLRRSLERYYLTAGRTDPVLITIPKGGYVPNFEARPYEAAEVPPPVPAGVTDAQLSIGTEARRPQAPAQRELTREQVPATRYSPSPSGNSAPSRT